MSKVLVALKVLPSDLSIDIKQIEKGIISKIPNSFIREEPIAFGLIALHVSTFVEDKEGEVERIEKLIKEVDGVGEVEVVEVARSL
ncbi:MAG: elongation factor 1-beta [Candidatus Aenigmatarchaeota archaeon]|jgi:elongation factor 1-beta